MAEVLRLFAKTAVLVTLPDALLILLFSPMGSGPCIYKAVADDHADTLGSCLVPLAVLGLLGFFVFDWHRQRTEVQVFSGFVFAAVAFAAAVCKAIKYPWAPMLICVVCSPVMIGCMKAKYQTPDVPASTFWRGVSVILVSLAVIIGVVWLLWLANQDRWLDEDTEAWLAAENAAVYEYLYPKMPLDYALDCNENTKDLDRLNVTAQERLAIEQACVDAAAIWSLQWSAPLISVLCNFLGACFCALAWSMTDAVSTLEPKRDGSGNSTSGWCHVVPQDATKVDLGATVSMLKRLVLVITLALSAVYCSLYVSGAAVSLGSVALCVASSVTTATLGWIYLEVDHSQLQEVIGKSKLGGSMIKLMRSDWTKAIAVGGLHVFIPFCGLLDILRKKQRRFFKKEKSKDLYTIEGRRIIDELAKWYWASILTKVSFLAEVFILMLVGSKVTFVFFSWLVKSLDESGIDVAAGSVMVLLISIAMFMCPIVPGSAVYLFAGVVLAAFGESSGTGFWPGFASACVVGSLAKHIACVGQYFLGYLAGQSVRVQRFVGVDTVTTRATERILMEPGFSLGKVCILVAGPDFPTSMLCGILGLDVGQMLVGTCPVILVSIIPQTLVGALLVKDSSSPFWDTFATVATGGAAAAQAVAMLVFTWHVMKVIERHGEELAKPRKEHKAVAELTEKEKEFVDAYFAVTQWGQLSRGQKVVLLGSSGGFLLAGFAFSGDYVMAEKFCFRSFAITDDIGSPIEQGGLDGAAHNLVMPVGWAMLGLASAAFVLDIVFRKRAAAAAKAHLAQPGPTGAQVHPDAKPTEPTAPDADVIGRAVMAASAVSAMA